MSHGRLIHHDLSAAGAVAGAPLGELGAEILSRLTTATSQESRKEFERHLLLLTRLHEATGDRMETPENRLSVAHFHGQFRFLRHCLERHRLPFDGATHVDIGCGSVNPLARLFTHVLLGVRKAIGIDLDAPDPQAEAVAARCLARIAAAGVLEPERIFGTLPTARRDVLARLEGFDVTKLRAGDPSGIDASRLTLRQAPIEATGLDSGSVDLVISNSVLEHVHDVDAAVAELARITRPGGYGVHGIDTIDHRWYGEPHLHPLEFLTVDAATRMVSGCNRLRLWEFPAIFARHGFELLDHWIASEVAITPELRARMVEPWRSMTDAQLDRTWAQVLIRRI